MYKFTDALLIGEAMIDEEHKMLFQMLNEAQTELENGFCPKEALIRMRENLVSYANTHFAHEEEYMQSIHDPELAIQEKEHNAFRKRVADISENIDSVQDAYKEMQSLLEFIAKWLYRHIINSDCLIGHITRVEEENADTMFNFTSKYMTGIEVIDEEHKKLFDIMRRSFEELRHHKEDENVDSFDEVLGIIDELVDYSQTHFADEEEYMSSINYEGLIAQQRAHQMFIEKLDDIDLEGTSIPASEYLEDVIDFVLYWLTNHILKMDTLIPMKNQK